MRLAAKITLSMMVGIFAVLAARGYVQVRNAIHDFRENRREGQLAIARLFAPAVARAWRLEGRISAMYLIEYTKRLMGHTDIRWVQLDGRDPSHAPRAPQDRLGPISSGAELSLVAQAEPGETRLYTYVPLRIGMDGEPAGALELSEPLDSERRYLRSAMKGEAITTAALAGVCGLIALGVGAWFVGRPVRKLVEQARRVGGGDLSRRLELRQRDEIGQLAREMDTMCSRLAEANERVASEVAARIRVVEQADRLMATGKLAAGLAHELGTPLNVVSGRARMIASGDVSAEETGQNARIILKQADRIGHIVRQLLDFARPRQATRSPIDLMRLARKALDLLDPMVQKTGVTLSLQADGGLPRVPADREQLQQVVTNLAVNGIQAMPHGGELVVQMRHERVCPPPDHAGPEGEYLHLTVRDQGGGIPPEHLPHIFEPFYTTKDVGEGNGLGLAICHGTVRDHGGWIAVESAVGRGSSFSVYLPLRGPS